MAQKKNLKKGWETVHTFNPNTEEVEAGVSLQVPGQSYTACSRTARAIERDRW